MRWAARLMLIAIFGLVLSACNDDALQYVELNPDDPVYDEPPPEPTPEPDSDGDLDGDGIPDDQDNIPCLAIYMSVRNENVSSAEVLLNDVILLDESSFPTDEVITQFINAEVGVNVLELGGKLNGSPDDLLNFHIADTEGVVYLHETTVRGNGTPQSVYYEFIVDEDCS